MDGESNQPPAHLSEDKRSKKKRRKKKKAEKLESGKDDAVSWQYVCFIVVCQFRQCFSFSLSTAFYSAKAGIVMWLFVPSVVLPVSTISHEYINESWPNMVGMGKEWPCGSDEFWCWSRSGCWSRSSFSHSLRLDDRHFYDILSLIRGHHCSGLTR